MEIFSKIKRLRSLHGASFLPHKIVCGCTLSPLSRWCSQSAPLNPLPLFLRKKGLSRYWTANYSRRRDCVSFEVEDIKDNPYESD